MLSFYTLDVFTDKRYGGNQLAVLPEVPALSDIEMQQIANEFNLSETVFLSKPHSDGSFDMRIFTPSSELPTAGHPTIGTAYYIAKHYNPTANKSGTIVLNQKVGKIEVDLDFLHDELQKATMYQPLPDFVQTFENRVEIASLLSLKEEELLPSPIQKVSCGVPYVIIPVKSIDSIRKIKFRLDIWDQLKNDLNGFVYAFCIGGERPGSNLHGRMFAPEAGILEDPATGSANGPLGCYVTHHNLAKSPFISEQGFEMGRPSIIEIDIQGGSGQIEAVKVGGSAVFVSKGELFI